MVIGGMVGESPHMIAAAVMAQARLLYEFGGALSGCYLLPYHTLVHMHQLVPVARNFLAVAPLSTSIAFVPCVLGLVAEFGVPARRACARSHAGGAFSASLEGP